MTQAVIGALRVNLGLDSAEFKDGMDKARQTLGRFGEALKTGLAAAAAGAAAGLGAVAVAVGNNIEKFDQLGKLASQVGLPVDELSRLKYAADLSGLSLEELGKGVAKLSVVMSDTMAGGTSAASAALRQLGIAVTNNDGTMRTSREVLGDLANQFGAMQDGAEKTALASRIFGEELGARFIPMLNMTEQGLQKAGDEAARFGIVVTEKTKQAAEAFNDNMTRLQAATSTLTTRLTVELLPALELLSERFVEVVSDGERMEQLGNSVSALSRWIANEFGQASIIVARLSAEISGLMEALSRFNNYDFKGAWKAWMDGQNASVKMMEDMKAQVNSLFDGSAVSQGQIGRRISDAFGTAGAESGTTFGNAFTGTLTPILSELPKSLTTATANASGALAAAATTMTDAWDGLRTASANVSSQFENIGDIAQSVGSTIGSSLAGLIKGTSDWSDVLADVAGQLLQLALSSFGGGGGLGGLFKGLLGSLAGGLPGFANGGTHVAGGAALVPIYRTGTR